MGILREADFFFFFVGVSAAMELKKEVVVMVGLLSGAHCARMMLPL